MNPLDYIIYAPLPEYYKEAYEHNKKVHSCDKCIAQLKTSMKLLKHLAECLELGKKDKLYYNECGFNCKTKKTLKAMSHCKQQFTLHPSTKAQDPKECEIL